MMNAFFGITTADVMPVDGKTAGQGCGVVTATQFKVTLPVPEATMLEWCLKGDALCKGTTAFPKEVTRVVTPREFPVCVELTAADESAQLSETRTAMQSYLKASVTFGVVKDSTECTTDSGSSAKELMFEMSGFASTWGVFSDCLYNVTECQGFPSNLFPKYGSTDAPATSAPGLPPAEKTQVVRMCVSGTMVLADVANDMSRFLLAKVDGINITADGFGCTNSSYRVVSLAVPEAHGPSLEGCVSTSPGDECRDFPFAVLPYVTPSTASACIPKDSLESVQTELEAFMQSTVRVMKSEGNGTCPEGSVLVEVAVSTDAAAWVQYSTCAKESTASGCDGFPKGFSAAGNPTPTPREADEDDGFPIWIIVVIAVVGSILAGGIGVFLYMRSRKPNFKMNFGEQCGALDELEMENDMNYHPDAKAYEQYDDEQPIA
eukprot:TRINITY_DN4232_c0_g2_i1.p1 TRINITY_DN4232_c0_g2~~TRINITY_DN4232_c0_g2_i1.p1  ORF type:complete len:446 (+),score=166.02 TRINITY_DN4232_c0_g2_i1:38-1339(+)